MCRTRAIVHSRPRAFVHVPCPITTLFDVLFVRLHIFIKVKLLSQAPSSRLCGSRRLSPRTCLICPKSSHTANWINSARYQPNWWTAFGPCQRKTMPFGGNKHTHIDIFKLAKFSTGPFNEPAMMDNGPEGRRRKAEAAEHGTHACVPKRVLSRKWIETRHQMTFITRHSFQSIVIDIKCSACFATFFTLAQLYICASRIENQFCVIVVDSPVSRGLCLYILHTFDTLFAPLLLARLDSSKYHRWLVEPYLHKPAWYVICFHTLGTRLQSSLELCAQARVCHRLFNLRFAITFVANCRIQNRANRDTLILFFSRATHTLLCWVALVPSSVLH